MKRFLHVLSLIVAVMLIATPAFPNGITLDDVIWDNGNFQMSGPVSDATWPDYPQYAADNFSLSGSYVITDFHWTGYYGQIDLSGDGYVDIDNFTLTLYSDSGGLPGAQIFQETVGNVSKESHEDIDQLYNYWTFIDPLYIGTGEYWLAIWNNTFGDIDTWAWGASAFDHSAFSQDLAVNWHRMSSETVFKITGYAIPEPSTFFLLGTGLLGVIGIARRRKS